MKKHFFSLFLLLFLFSCANIVPPKGGARDVIAPVVLGGEPFNYSTGFNAKRVVITFDEYIQLVNPAENIIISPPMDPAPDIRVRRKSIIIDIKDTLEENTTYTINFGEAVRDITEGNTLDDFRYVFATGPELDSLAVSGKAYFAKDHTTERGILVMLYKDLSDSAVHKKKPFYFTKTLADGTFKISNIAEGSYRLYALKDQNFNFIYDLPNEEIAFIDMPIVVDTTLNYYTLALFQKEQPQQLLNTFSPAFGRVKFIFAQPIEDISIQPYTSGKKFFSWHEQIKQDTIQYWLSDPYRDSMGFLIFHKGAVMDTAMVGLKNISKDSVLKANLILKPEKIKISPVDTFVLRANRPLRERYPGKIQILKDSLPANDISLLSTSGTTRELKFFGKWKEGAKYQIVIDDSALVDIFSLTNDSANYAFTIGRTEDYGNLILQFSAEADAPLILQIQKNNEVISSIITSGRDTVITYKYLEPATYSVRAIEDVNNSSTWNTGNFEQQKQPERIYYYKENPAIRANWDMEIKWHITKDQPVNIRAPQQTKRK